MMMSKVKSLKENRTLSLFGIEKSNADQAQTVTLTDSMLRLAAQSNYAPTDAQLSNFLTQVFAGSQSGVEQFRLLILTDHSGIMNGFLQIRFFADCADLDFIIVDSALRGRGHALEMMDFIIAELRLCHVNRILLEVGVDNDSAIRFYTRIGFKEISRRRGYYRSGEDAFVMELNL